MSTHNVDRQLIVALARSAVAMGHGLGRAASLADLDAVADRLSSVVLAALPTVVVDEDCMASVSLDEVEACCQHDRLSHECDLAAEHRGPHRCGWCSLRFADYVPEPLCPIFHEVEIEPPGPVQPGVVRTVAPFACTLPGGHTTSHRDKLGNWWPNVSGQPEMHVSAAAIDAITSVTVPDGTAS